MRHRKRRTKFNRTTAHRKATLSMIAKHLLIHQRIKTTHTKAKEARRLVEKLITLAKNDNLSARRRVFSVLKDRKTTLRLFNETVKLFQNRIGGYTRIIPLKYRRGDGADIVMLELTEKIKKEETAKKPKAKEKKPEAPKLEKEKERPKAEVHRSGPEIKPEVKDEKIVEEVKKEKAKLEEKRIEKKSFFKKFFRRRTKM